MRRASRQRGFTYLSLIILVAIIGLVAAATLKMGSVIQRSRAEQQLLDIGEEFSDALQSYADATPAGMPTQPPSLKELLRDPRFPGVRRHLRKIYVDPMTGKAEWGIVYLGEKVGVLAVYSLSNEKPVKIGNFAQRFAGFEGKQKLSEWRFEAVRKPDGAGTAGTATTPAATAPLTPLTPLTPLSPGAATPATTPTPASASASPAAEPPPPVPTATPPEAPPPGEPQVEQPDEPAPEEKKD